MQRNRLAVLCGLIVTMVFTQVAAADVGDLIPEDVLLAVVVNDMSELHGEVLDLVNKVQEGAPVPDLWNALLDGKKWRSQVIETKPDGTQFLVEIPTVINRKKPFVFVMPDPGQEHRKDPLTAMMIPVSDYAKFLKELATVKTKEGDVRVPGQSVDGFDLIGDDRPGEGTYLMKRADYAIVAETPAALKALRGQKRSCLNTLNGRGKKVFLNSDVAVYLNCPKLLTTYRKDIDDLVKQMEVTLKQTPALAPDPDAPAAKPDPAQAQMIKNLKAQVALFVELAEQFEPAVVGLNVEKEHVKMTGLVSCKPDTMLGRCLKGQKPSAFKLLKHLDKEAWLAASFDNQTEANKELTERMLKFVADSGMTAMVKDFNTDEYLATARELNALTSGEIAVALYPPEAPQNGIINLVEIATCKDSDRARELMSKQLQAALAGAIPNAPGIEFVTTHSKNVEPGIDRIVMELKVAEDPGNFQAQQTAMMLQMIYGNKIVLHTMGVAQKYIVITLGDRTTRTIKAVTERIAANRDGTLTTSTGFKRATTGLATTKSALCYFSLTRTVKAMVPVMGMVAGGGPAPNFVLPADADESGIAMQTVFSGNTARFDVIVPIQEVVNVKKMVEKAMADMQANPNM